MLNKPLFDLIQHCLGKAQVRNPDCHAKVSYRPDWRRGGRLTHRVSGGEEYVTNCPFCNDTRGRLYIHYLYDQRDERTGYDNRRLAHCHNENCFGHDPACYERLWDRLSPWNLQFNMGCGPQPKASVDEELALPIIPSLPEECLPITDDGVPSEAVAYLTNRDFDPDELWRLWRVRYCESSSTSNPRLRFPSLIIPVYGFGTDYCGRDDFWVKLTGWQARALDGVGFVPKYLTMRGMPRNQSVYGLTRAVLSQGPLVICEGVTDVWRLRDSAVAIFGKTVSHNQIMQILAVTEDRPIVVFADRDAVDEARKVAGKLRDNAGLQGYEVQVEVALPPKGKKDAGECSRREAWACVCRALNISHLDLQVDFGDEVPSKHPPRLVKRRRLR